MKFATCLLTNNDSAMLCYWMYTIQLPQTSPWQASFGVELRSSEKQARKVVLKLQEQKFCCTRKGVVWSNSKKFNSVFFHILYSRCYHKHIPILELNFLELEHTLTFSRMKQIFQQMFQRKEVDPPSLLKNLNKTLRKG